MNQSQSNKAMALLVSIFATQFFFSENASAEVLWDNWYVSRTNGVAQYYFNEHAEITGDKAKIRVNYWIKEGTRIKSENIGATAKNSPLLEPLVYNFKTQDAGSEKTMDGTIMGNGKIFSVKIKKGVKNMTPLRAQMIPNLILSSFFPVWIHKNYKKISSVQPKEFAAIIENEVDTEVPVTKGDVYEMVPDDFAKKTQTRKLRVNFKKVVSFWYVTPKGDAIRIIAPNYNSETKKVSREEAEKSLQ